MAPDAAIKNGTGRNIGGGQKWKHLIVIERAEKEEEAQWTPRYTLVFGEARTKP